MTIYKFPDEDKVKRTHHQPEFVVLDEFEEVHFEQEEPISSIKNLTEIKAPLGLRFFCLASSLVMGLLTTLLLGLTVFVGLLSLLMLEKSVTLNSLFEKFFKGLQKTSVFTLGLFIGTFSISFGIGIIILFFFLRGEQMDSVFLSRLSRFRPND